LKAPPEALAPSPGRAPSLYALRAMGGTTASLRGGACSLSLALGHASFCCLR
jgi:hypothetical protein